MLDDRFASCENIVSRSQTSSLLPTPLKRTLLGPYHRYELTKYSIANLKA